MRYIKVFRMCWIGFHTHLLQCTHDFSFLLVIFALCTWWYIFWRWMNMIGVSVSRMCWKVFYNVCWTHNFSFLFVLFCSLHRIVKLLKMDENDKCYSIQNCWKLFHNVCCAHDFFSQKKSFIFSLNINFIFITLEQF